jgi:predicted ATP-grasp superfamily ATP-dependent carboligase
MMTVSSRSNEGVPGAIVLGSDYKALGIVRSLGRHGIRVWVLQDEHALASYSRYCVRTLSWPAAAEAQRVHYLLALSERYGLGGWTIFPTDDETAALLSRNRQALAERYLLTVPRWDVLRWAYDKRLTYRLAAGLDIDHPRTQYPQTLADLRSLHIRYPAILKPAVRADLNPFTMSKAWRVDDPAELAARYAEASALIDPSLIMVQELIEGGGACQLSYAALCREGRPVASVVARRTRQWPMDFGRASTYVETIEAPDVEEIATRLLAVLGYEGIVEVEFKRDPRDGHLKLLDINPRVWGWHTLGGRAGVDFPYLLWRMTTGASVSEMRGRSGVRWVRALTDLPTAFGEMRAGRLSVGAYLASLRGPIEFAILAADDPVPALVELPAALYLSWRRRASARHHLPEPRSAAVPSGQAAAR